MLSATDKGARVWEREHKSTFTCIFGCSGMSTCCYEGQRKVNVGTLLPHLFGMRVVVAERGVRAIQAAHLKQTTDVISGNHVAHAWQAALHTGTF